ncbi:MAG TPA: cytochrome b [Gammaproteobacteria bacterium]|nr:cytochrome b [Gammaproteobacteria bacterium]HBF07312.1 cytochrome b [Gammaproteobacteria bacterium]HCK91544.1 cytochrome b [Gammaproteobacteria bacterium]|tara:strand:+ start:23168 stop:23707 length:540 start_codon:yes stop_codon:yes gene_type:complete
MRLTNTENRFGIISVLFHWVFALAVITLLGTGIYMVGLSYYSPWYHPMPKFHQQLGIATIIIFALRAMWHFIHKQPKIKTKKRWEKGAAKAAHHLMLLLSAGILISGYIMVSVEVEFIEWFQFQLPTLTFDIENQADLAGFWHKYLAYGLIGIISVHVLAALKHQFIDKDRILQKIFGL